MVKMKYLAIPIFISLGLCFTLAGNVNSSSRPKQDLSPNLDYLDKKIFNDYILGPGDVIRVVPSKLLPQYSNTYIIDSSGTILPPKLKRIYVSGLTITELTNLLNKKYLDYFIEPDVELDVVRYRAIRVYVSGEVNIPGMYSLEPVNILPTSIGPDEGINQITDITDIRSAEIKNQTPQYGAFDGNGNFTQRNYSQGNSIATSFFPTVFDAIRIAGGITEYSDLSELIIKRKNSLSNGGGYIQTKVNFMNVIEKGDQSQNIRLYDGDYITINTSKDNNNKQLAKAIQSNLNPRYIRVNVFGRVEAPGVKVVGKASSLNDSLELAGGTKLLKGPIRFVRVNIDGTIDRRKFIYNSNVARGSYNNPILQNGDIIFVGKSLFNRSTEFISEITSPFAGLLSSFAIYEALSD